jgi:hypothetical protein
MSAWSTEELGRVGTAEELHIASRFPDGTTNRVRTIWVVRHGDDLYVRSVNGPTAAWYSSTRAQYEGHIQAGGVAKDATFVDADDDLSEDLDFAYRSRYRRYSATLASSWVNGVCDPCVIDGSGTG